MSRFKDLKPSFQKKYNGLLLISGPDEYVSYLIKSNLSYLNSGEIELIVGGKKHLKIIESFGFSHLFKEASDWRIIDDFMLNSKTIYGYCGYTTLMDLKYLNCKAQLIPCKGQLEQIYLRNINFQNFMK